MSATGDFVEGNSLVEQLAQPGSRLRKELAMAVSAVNNVLVSEQQTALTQVRRSVKAVSGINVLYPTFTSPSYVFRRKARRHVFHRFIR